MNDILAWQRFAPPLPNDHGCLEQAVRSLFPIVRFCSHRGAGVRFPTMCNHPGHQREVEDWRCRCCQTGRFRNILGRYVDVLTQGRMLPTALTGTKMKNRAYRFVKRGSRLYFSIRRHPKHDEEVYSEIEQRWCFDLQSRAFVLEKEKHLG